MINFEMMQTKCYQSKEKNRIAIHGRLGDTPRLGKPDLCEMDLTDKYKFE